MENKEKIILVLCILTLMAQTAFMISDNMFIRNTVIEMDSGPQFIAASLMLLQYIIFLIIDIVYIKFIFCRRKKSSSH